MRKRGLTIARGVVDADAADAPFQRERIHGERPNRDVVLTARS
jgi:hypothetical protein